MRISDLSSDVFSSDLERTPLSAVVAEANRDSATSIRLADPGIGALRVSGRFRVDNADLVADRLAVLFDLDVERTKSDEITLRKRSSTIFYHLPRRLQFCCAAPLTSHQIVGNFQGGRNGTES